MTFRNISVQSEVYDKLKSLKEPGDSFSKVLLRELPSPEPQAKGTIPLCRRCRALILTAFQKPKQSDKVK
jgi:hypothetical protein